MNDVKRNPVSGLFDDDEDWSGEDWSDLRMSLPEYQRRLNQELDATKGSSIEAFVAAVSDDTHWLVGLGELKETAVLPEVARIGMVQPWVLGIANFRGHVHTVVDMRYMISRQRTTVTYLGRATLLHPRYATNVALLWPEVVGMIPKNQYKLSDREPQVPAERRGWVKQVWEDPRGVLWHEMDVAALTSTDEMTNAVKL